MNTTTPQVLPAPPSLMKSLMAGFDAITNHVGLILFPIVLDLVLWLGPHLSLANLIQTFSDQVAPPGDYSSVDLPGMVSAVKEMWAQIGHRFNLLSFLRSYPVGVPSLMAARSPVDTPLSGLGQAVSVPSLGLSLALGLGLVLIGLVVGSLYFSSVAQAALTGEVRWEWSIRRWAWVSAQVLLLALLLIGLLLAIGLPFSCVLSVLVLFGGSSFIQIILLLVGGLLIWMLMPLAFSAHGIFVYGHSMWNAVKDSVSMTRFTLPSTGLFLLMVVVLSEGLDLLWSMPPESSWLSLVGVAGHAFVTTGLLAASFIYYHDANAWVVKVMAQVRQKT